MELQQLDWKNYTTETNIFNYKIPNVDENIATIEVISTKNSNSGETKSVVTINKTTTNKVLKECTPAFVKRSFFELIKTKSPFDYRSLTLEDYLFSDDSILSEDISEKNLIWFYFSGDMLFKTNGIPIATPIYYDYIGTPFSNEYCYLKPLLNYLKEHPWVVNKEDLEIENIPYYNSEKNRDRCIRDICICPDQDTYDRVYQQYSGDKYFSRRIREAISSQLFMYNSEKHHDWLGIAPFLKNPPKQLAQDS
jgi:hypothetical protein